MDTEAFSTMLRTTFSNPRSAAARDPRLDAVVEMTDGMSTSHSLTVLSMAVSCLEPGEIYLEVGSYRGRSMIGALLNNPGACGVGIENFGEFEAGQPARTQLEKVISEAGLVDRATMIYADAFGALAKRDLGHPVGVYFYDGVHSAFGQYAGLGLAERHLADEAVVIVDDASWPQVARATDDYVNHHPGYRLIAEFPADDQDDPIWCNGLRVYIWQRPADWRPPAVDVQLRAFLQSRVTGPARTLAWRLLGNHPRAMSVIRRVVTRGSTTVPTTPGAR